MGGPWNTIECASWVSWTTSFTTSSRGEWSLIERHQPCAHCLVDRLGQGLALRDECRVLPGGPPFGQLGAARRRLAAPLDARLGRAVLAHADDGAATSAGDVGLLPGDIALVDAWH